MRLILALVLSALYASAQSASPADWLEGIYLHVEYGYGVGGMVTTNYKPHIFLKDGSVTTDLSFYPATASDVQAWRGRNPRAWGKWSREGSITRIEWNDAKRKPQEWKKWFTARPGDPGMRLSGHYRSMGGGGNTALGGDVMIAAWNNMTFSPDGTVTTGGGSGASSGGGGTGVSVTTRSRKAPQQARYSISGFTMQLERPGQPSETRWFFRYPDSDTVIGIGGSTFVQRKN